MTTQSCTTIAAIILENAPELGINTLADEILQSAIAQRAGARSVCWDCDDLVFLDFDMLRIALHEIPATDETPYVVCLGVGPVPERSLPTHIDSTRLAHGLVKRLTQIVTANAVLWHEDTRALSTFVMDDFQDELDSMLCYLALQLNGTTGTVEEEQKAAKPKSCAIKDEVALARLRDQLRKKGRAKAPISRPIHISLYLLACTFFLTIPAMGSALLSYVWLRDGVDKPSTPT